MKQIVLFLAIALLSLSVCIEGRAKPDDDFSSSEEMDFSFNTDLKTTAAPNKTQAAPSAVAPSAVAPSAAAPAVAVQNLPTEAPHHHHHTQQTPKVPQSINAMSGSLLESSAGYNQTCSNTDGSAQCDRTKNLVCSDMKKCVCDPSKKTILIKRLGKCVEIAAVTTTYSCDYDEQCQEGSFGPYSICDQGTKRCACVPSVGEKPVIMHNSQCYIQKRIGDYCKDNEVCRASIDGNTDCIPNPPGPTNGSIILDPVDTNNTRCNCAWDHVFHNTSNSAKDECLKIGTSESSECKADVQCKTGLGELSRCFGQRCQCADVFGKDVVVFYKEKCYKKLNLQDVCEYDIQCQAGISDDAVCALHESYLPNQKTCQCPEGKTCERRSEDGAAGLLVSVTLVLTGIVASKVIT